MNLLFNSIPKNENNDFNKRLERYMLAGAACPPKQGKESLDVRELPAESCCVSRLSNVVSRYSPCSTPCRWLGRNRAPAREGGPSSRPRLYFLCYAELPKYRCDTINRAEIMSSICLGVAGYEKRTKTARDTGTPPPNCCNDKARWR